MSISITLDDVRKTRDYFLHIRSLLRKPFLLAFFKLNSCFQAFHRRGLPRSEEQAGR